MAVARRGARTQKLQPGQSSRAGEAANNIKDHKISMKVRRLRETYVAWLSKAIAGKELLRGPGLQIGRSFWQRRRGVEKLPSRRISPTDAGERLEIAATVSSTTCDAVKSQSCPMKSPMPPFAGWLASFSPAKDAISNFPGKRRSGSLLACGDPASLFGVDME